jgi:hypothetical protein
MQRKLQKNPLRLQHLHTYNKKHVHLITCKQHKLKTHNQHINTCNFASQEIEKIKTM